jgi:hypothetical protein
MNHAELGIIVLDDLSFYLTVYTILVVFYLLLYRKIYWGIFDPMIWTVINMSGGAFCVFFLYSQENLTPFYKWSFITTELALFISITLSRYLPSLDFSNIFPKRETNGIQIKITEFDVFVYLIGSVYIICEIASFMIIGIVLFDEDVNHISAFADHGILMAFITSFRLLCPFALFYKHLVLNEKFNYFDILCWIFAGFGILTTGSKSAILIFFFQYFIIKLPLILSGKSKPIKISVPAILGLVCFPVLVIAVGSGASTMIAIQSVFIRLLSSGDVFLLGYNDYAMGVITEKSFLNYAFYPGWGTVLKNLGFNFVPPQAIGADILNYYYGKTDGGPNGRYNYIALHFFGFWGAIPYAAVVGLFVGIIRNAIWMLDPDKISYFGYILITLLIYLSNLLIDDINIFSNYNFWRVFFLVLSYVITKIIYLIIKKRIVSLST